MSKPPSRPARRILHVDVDAMFVQCAVLDDPRLDGASLILVGGRPEGRGVVTSASYGCRAYGIRSAMPMATAVRLCPRALVVPVPGGMIRAKSRELLEVLQGWAPVAARASVDEVFLDLSGTEALYRGEPLEATARRIRADVRERTRLDVSIGGATNRYVAKLATGVAKPAGVLVIPPGEEAAFVGGLEIGDLTGIGPALQEDLRRRGVTTVEALRALDAATLCAWFGEERGGWIWRRARGIDDSPVVAGEAPRSISSEETFPTDVGDLRALEQHLLAQVVGVARSLRKQGLAARTVTVKLRDADLRIRSRSRTLSEQFQTERVIFEVARRLLADLHGQRGVPARLVGVALGGFTPAGAPEQWTLIELAPPLEEERDRALAGAIDRIRARHGEVIGPGSVGSRRRGETVDGKQIRRSGDRTGRVGDERMDHEEGG